MEKRIIVTGATRGIGKAIAEKFLQEGFSLTFCGTQSSLVEQRLKDWKAQFDQPIFGQVADLSVVAQVKAFAEFALEKMGNVEVLVNNAGLYLPGSVLEEEEGVFEKLMLTNVSSAYHLSRALIPQMKKLERSHVFNMCSTASIMPYVNGGSYCISKFGLLGMNKVLREELKHTGVGVTAVMPGATYTDSWAGVELPLSRFMLPEDIAEAIFSAWKVSKHTVVEELLLRPRAGDI